MANASTTGFGLRMAMRLGNTPSIEGQSKYKIKSGLGVGIFKGNPASLQDGSGDQGYLQDASIDTTDDTGAGGIDYTTATEALLVGVFNGAFYIDNTTSKPTFANSVAASTTFGTNPNTGSTDGFGFVNDDPLQEYTVKADAAVTQAMIGTVGNMNDFAATNAKNGQSTSTLDVGTRAETKMFRIVRVAEDPQNEDATAAGCNIIVVQNGAANLFINGRDS
jgi:hypothetical protein|tara:strand:+ start:367 stop:1029 length:663 start_codon:yes stop_codon:yes gene_type:complete